MTAASTVAMAPSPRAPWPWRIAAALATVGAGALLAVVVAWWGWRWFGPTAAPAAAAPAGAPVAALVAAAPFGRATTVGAKVAARGATVTAFPADARLLGVFAGRDGDGYALLNWPGRGAVLVRRGQEIATGFTLDAVLADGIRIRDHNAVRDLLLRPDAQNNLVAPVPAGRPSPPKPAATGARGSKTAAAAGRAACAVPAGFSGPVYRLNAELLSGMAAQPQAWGALLAPAKGALVVRDDTGLAAMLGMKAGDRIVQANGIALLAIDDVLSAIVKPLSASQPVRLSGARGGKPREWLFLNAGACPG